MGSIRNILVIGIVFLVFSNFLSYLLFLDKLPQGKTIVYLLLNVIVISLSNKIRITKYAYIWASIYIVISTVYFIFSISYIETSVYYKHSVVAALMLILFTLVLQSSTNAIALSRETILYVTIFNCVLLIYDFIQPGFFIPLDSNLYIDGRGSAMFMNPNIAGTAVLLGLIFTIDIVPKKFRELYLVIILLGVLTTMSRAAISLYLMLLIVYFLKRTVNRKYLSIYFGIAVASSTLVATSLIGLLQSNNISTSNIENRISFILSIGQKGRDASYGERIFVLEKAYEIFINSPLFGAGFAVTRVWDYPQSPHNFYIMGLAEYGLLSLLILPLLFFLVRFKAQGRTLQIANIFILFMAFNSLFTHNILESTFYIFCFSLMFAMSSKSQYQIYNMKEKR
tara:strand:- start:2704 stop:3891 length:1188 start_codon:yes stop_codon:yes gene_type:complete